MEKRFCAPGPLASDSCFLFTDYWSLITDYFSQEGETMPERVLRILLRLVALGELSAFFAIFLPHAWMGRAHEWLGMGAFPDEPVVDYLARTLSALYRALLTWVIYTGIAFGVLVTVAGMQAGFPLWWTLGEGPFLVVLSVVFLLLQRKLPREVPVAR
jgi:hypothetical protein